MALEVVGEGLSTCGLGFPFGFFTSPVVNFFSLNMSCVSDISAIFWSQFSCQDLDVSRIASTPNILKMLVLCMS